MLWRMAEDDFPEVLTLDVAYRAAFHLTDLWVRWNSSRVMACCCFISTFVLILLGGLTGSSRS
jgi:hypothetical protein